MGSNQWIFHRRLLRNLIHFGKILWSRGFWKQLHTSQRHVILNKIWAFGDKTPKLDVYEMDSTMMRIRITSAVVRDKVMRREMWNIAGVPMVVLKWSPEEDTSKAHFDTSVSSFNECTSEYVLIGRVEFQDECRRGTRLFTSRKYCLHKFWHYKIFCDGRFVKRVTKKDQLHYSWERDYRESQIPVASAKVYHMW